MHALAHERSTGRAIERLAYSTAEAAEALGVTRQHVHNLIVRGELRSVKLGRSRRIPATELHRILGDPVGGTPRDAA